MRVPWLLVGLIGGVVVMLFVPLPFESASSFAPSLPGALAVCLACLMGGLLVGFVLDAIAKRRR